MKIINPIIAAALLIASLQVSMATEKLQPAQIKEDLTELFSGLEQAHVNLYANIDEQQYKQYFEQAISEINRPMTISETQVLLQKFVALGKVAHAKINFPDAEFTAYREAAGKTFPVYLQRVAGRWYVDDNYSSSEIPAKAELVAIDGEPMEQVFQAIRAHISADTEDIAASLLEFQLPQYLWLIHGAREFYDLELSVNGDTELVRVATLTRGELEQRFAQKKEQESEQDRAPRVSEMLDDNIAYIRPGPFYNIQNPQDPWDASAFKVFVDDSFAQFIEAGAEDLIIDLRENPGGDNSFSDALIAWFADKPFRFASTFRVKSSPQAQESNGARVAARAEKDQVSDSFRLDKLFKSTPHGEVFDFEISLAEPKADKRFGGNIYALVNKHSYSNAVSVAAIIQDYGFGVVVGQSTTDFATTYGAMESFELSHSKIKVGFPKALIIRPNGDQTPGPVIPDLQLEQSLGEEGDTVLAKLRQHVVSARKSSVLSK
ncbi:MAG: S41 family peptidase [Pseudomonadota bacterium]